jgi:hypothetical protein
MSKIIFICTPSQLSYALGTFGKTVATLLISDGDSTIFNTIIRESTFPIEIVSTTDNLLQESLLHSLFGRERIIFVASNIQQQITMRMLAMKHDYTIAS